MPQRTPTLLVVDDEQDMLDFVERVFRRDYVVERACSMEEALPILTRGVVDVLITDRRMPRHSGEELLARAAVLQPSAVRIVLTGYTDAADPEPDVDAWLRKPVDSEALQFAVRDAIVRRLER